MMSELLAGDQRAGKIELVSISGGRLAHLVVEALLRIAVGFVQSLLCPGAGVEGSCPVRQSVLVEGRGDKCAALRIDPICGIGGVPDGKDRRTVLERDAEDLRLTDSRQPQFIAQGRSPLVAGRSPLSAFGGIQQADNLVAVILYGSYGALGVTGQIPPLVRVDAVPICVGAGAERRVSA